MSRKKALSYKELHLDHDDSDLDYLSGDDDGLDIDSYEQVDYQKAMAKLQRLDHSENDLHIPVAPQPKKLTTKTYGGKRVEEEKYKYLFSKSGKIISFMQGM
ncbi:hypothetical protein JTB14_012845 [Gonioctena quinquepunctata]|nr:hypothetical protein JTB14_012845 [Gonioctena quinquepunctata]